MGFELHPMTSALGVELRGVEVRTLSDADVTELKSILHTYGVVFFRELHLTPDEHLSLGRRLGEPSIFPVARLLGATEASFQRITDGPDSPSEADSWHTDVTWTASPPKYALLCAEEMPRLGGDTMWASMTAAYDALSPTMQQIVSGLRVTHSNENFIAALLRKRGADEESTAFADRLREAFPPVVHPLVRTHPDTGARALFLGGGFMRSVEGMHAPESDALLAFLKLHIESPRFHCRWRWTVGDLAIWDERSTNHRSVGDSLLEARTIRRIEIDGDRPYFDADRVARTSSDLVLSGRN